MCSNAASPVVASGGVGFDLARLIRLIGKGLTGIVLGMLDYTVIVHTMLVH